MRRRRVAAVSVTALVLAMMAPTAGWAKSPKPSPEAEPLQVAQAIKGTDTIVLSFDRKQSDPKGTSADVVTKMLGELPGVSVESVQPITSKTVSVTLDQEISPAQARQIEAAIEGVAGIQAAEAAKRYFPTTDDAYYQYQWSLDAANGSAYSINAGNAWPQSNGAGVVIGVLDTGINPHPDLTGSSTAIVGGNVVAGYDFISEATSADGNGWDNDPSDPGYTCPPAQTNGLRHGIAVSGTIAALTNNGQGMAGAAPGTKIQPIRVIGTCGALPPALIAGIRWGAGLSVSGAPPNPTPAKVLNLSLGGEHDCEAGVQNAINDAVAAGVTVVVAAGNESIPVANSGPANCANVISVAATGPSGELADYSNYATTSFGVGISAPGGTSACTNDFGYCILSTYNAGTPDYRGFIGTSVAAPHVAAVVAEMYAVNPGLTPAEIKTILASTATATGACGLACGPGIVNAGAAVSMAATQAGAGKLSPGTPTVSGSVVVGSTLSANPGSWSPAPDSFSYQWGRDGAAIADATGTTYPLTEADRGHSLTLTVTGHKAGYNDASTTWQAPSNVLGKLTAARPKITGKAKVNAKLKVKAGSWGPSPVKLTYRWYRSGNLIRGASKTTYKLKKADKGKKITVTVVGRKSGYQTRSRSSNATAKVK